MKKIYKKINRSVFFVFVSLPVFGQSTLEDYIQMGLSNNQEFIRQQLQTQIARKEWKEASGKYMPDISFKASYTRADGGRTIDIPAGDLINPVHRGMNEILSEERFPINVSNISEQFLPNDFHETKVRVIQPILNTTIYFNEKAKAAQVSVQRAREEAIKNTLIREIKIAYFKHLLAQEQVKIIKETQSLLLEILKVSKKLVANDKATRETIFSAEADLGEVESELASSIKNENTTRLFFNYLLDRDLEKSIDVDSASTTFSFSHSLENLQAEALDQRKEIEQLRNSMEVSNQLLKLKKSYLIPEINLVGDVGYQGFEYRFDTNQEYWLIRLELSWSIFQGFQNQRKIEKIVLKSKQLESRLTDLRQQIRLEVSNAFFEYEEAETILKSRKAQLKNASENFRIVSLKYQEGLVLPIELREARTAYTNAQLAEAIARYNLLIKIAALEASINLNIK